MCGIFAIFSKCHQPIPTRKYKGRKQTLREIAYQQSGKQRYRGPDYTGVELIEEDGVCMIHERLAVVGGFKGNQPFKSKGGDVLVIANGEIYNYLALSAEIAKLRGHYDPKSDCNVLVEMYEEFGHDLLEHITGMFAFAIYDRKTHEVMIARDPIGIIPLYKGEDDDGNLWIASEMKCLVDVCTKIEVFEPGTVLTGQVGNLTQRRFFNEKWLTEIPDEPTDLTVLRQKLENAVRTHLQCDVDFAALLSGGVDSSLIASIATKIKRERDPDFRLKTYSIGLEGAPDFKYSQMVADYIGSDHTEMIFTIDEGLDCIRDIIYKLETYDVTTVRCSIPMYLLSRRIKSSGIKMILSGEGADELLGGYLYFFKAPDAEQFHRELVARVTQLSYSDCLRANKSSMAWGIELRVPFLDTEFVNYIMSLKPDEKIPGDLNTFGHERSYRMEKYILRAAFTDNYLPDQVMWRQKEQFSDGVGYDWIDTIRDYAASHVTEDEYSRAKIIYPINTPTTKEAFYYRSIYEEMFPGNYSAATVKRWIPRRDWGCPEDPSGRHQAVHQAKNYFH